MRGIGAQCGNTVVSKAGALLSSSREDDKQRHSCCGNLHFLNRNIAFACKVTLLKIVRNHLEMVKLFYKNGANIFICLFTASFLHYLYLFLKPGSSMCNLELGYPHNTSFLSLHCLSLSASCSLPAGIVCNCGRNECYHNRKYYLHMVFYA